MRQRHGKSLLGAVENTVGNPHSLRQSPQSIFLSAPAKLPSRTQTRNPFGKYVVQKWRAHLERRGHAHAVDFGKDIAREVGLAVKIHELADPVRKPRSAEIIAQLLRRVMCAGLDQEICREQA